MQSPEKNIAALFSIRNQYGVKAAAEKKELLQAISINNIKAKSLLLLYYDVLLFMLAYPDNKSINSIVKRSLQELEMHISGTDKLQNRLYNSGITKTAVCAAFSFEIVKWLRQNRPQDITAYFFRIGG